jgi:hypothetical protein
VRQDVFRNVEMDEDEPRIVLRETLAVSLAQRGAGHDDGFGRIERVDRQRAHTVEPGCTVGVGQGLASPHFFDARRRMRVIGVHEPGANRAGQSRADGCLTGASRPDDHDRTWSAGQRHQTDPTAAIA